MLANPATPFLYDFHISVRPRAISISYADRLNLPSQRSPSGVRRSCRFGEGMRGLGAYSAYHFEWMAQLMQRRAETGSGERDRQWAIAPAVVAALLILALAAIAALIVNLSAGAYV